MATNTDRCWKATSVREWKNTSAREWWEQCEAVTLILGLMFLNMTSSQPNMTMHKE